MARIVQKFGGTSVADVDCIKTVARRVKLDEAFVEVKFPSHGARMVVSEELAEIGYLKGTTAPVPATTSWDKIEGASLSPSFLPRGGRGGWRTQG